jgi:biotin transport system substrate-specific component
MSANAVSAFWRGLQREVVVERRAVSAIAVVAVVSCMALAAEVRFYTAWSPAPFTLQTFFVYVAGASLGPALATTALGAYFLLGGVGLPIFTASVFGPTTGYLLGFILAARLISALTHGVGRPGTGRIALAMVAGGVVLLLCGSAYLGLFCGWEAWAAVRVGALLFLPAEAAKIAAAVAFCRSYRRRLRALFP